MFERVSQHRLVEHQIGDHDLQPVFVAELLQIPQLADVEARVLLLPGIERREGRRVEALELLKRLYRRGTRWRDAVGVLVGRIKRSWMVERREEDCQRARNLYTEGLSVAESVEDSEQAMYHAIIIAFLDLMISPPGSAVPRDVVAMAMRALDHCNGVLVAHHWRFATSGEAIAMLGDPEAAAVQYEKALTCGPDSRAVEAMYQQAALVFGRVYGEAGLTRVATIFRSEKATTQFD